MTNNDLAVQGAEILDEELKQILRSRYEDITHLFTPEAQKRRRNSRLVFTLRISVLMGSLVGFMAWADGMHLMAHSTATVGISICTMVVGYFAGVCVSHMKGWRD